MSTERFIENLRQQLRDLHAKASSPDLTGPQKVAITRDIRFIEKKLALAVREKIK
jgi:hypothetical protein